MSDPDVIPTLPAPPSIREVLDVPTPSQIAALKAREEIADRKHKQSRKWEYAAILTVVATMVTAVSTMVASISHDLAAVRIAEAKRSCP